MPFAKAIQVLIVDDQLTGRALIRDGLQQLEIEDIEMATDGQDGLKEMMEKPVHLVISDLDMPKLDGIGFLRAVRAHPPTKGDRLHRADRARRLGDHRESGEIRREQLSGQAVHDAGVEGRDRGGARKVKSSMSFARCRKSRGRSICGIEGEYRPGRVLVTDDPTSWSRLLGSWCRLHLLVPGSAA